MPINVAALMASLSTSQHKESFDGDVTGSHILSGVFVSLIMVFDVFCNWISEVYLLASHWFV